MQQFCNTQYTIVIHFHYTLTTQGFHQGLGNGQIDWP